MIEIGRTTEHNRLGRVKRGVAAMVLAGATGLAGWGVWQLVDGIFFSSPDAESYPSHSTSDPRYIRDAQAQGKEVMDGWARTGEGFGLGVGALLVEDLGILAFAVAAREGLRRAMAEADAKHLSTEPVPEPLVLADVVDLTAYREQAGPSQQAV